MRVRFHDADGYTVGAIDIPHAAGKFTVAAVGESRADALVRAAAIANRITSDPIMRAILPPQAQAAINAARGLAAAAKAGAPMFRSVWRRLRGAGVTRLARALEVDPKTAQAVSDVGWNPFKRKKKKSRGGGGRQSDAPPSRQRRQRDDEGGDEGDEQQDEGAEE